jgi:hypothetical protein
MRCPTRHAADRFAYRSWRLMPTLGLDALRAPRRTERRFANRMLPRSAAQHANAARLGLASPSALALCFSLAARFAVAAPLRRQATAIAGGPSWKFRLIEFTAYCL